jgi:hypothetical protein
LTEEILDQDLDEGINLARQRHYTKWAKRWGWISVMILFGCVFVSGVMMQIFRSRTKDAYQFLNLTLMMVGLFLILLTLSNSISLYFRWKAFNLVAARSDRDYFNLILSILFLVAPILLALLLTGAGG